MSRTKGSFNDELRHLRQGKNLIKSYYNRVGWDKLEKAGSSVYCYRSVLWHVSKARIKVLIETLKIK